MRTFWHKVSLVTVLFALSISAAAAPPNIVFILADDLGYGDLGCFGQQDIRTPHLDTMAAQGMRFTQCYSGSTVCAPSRSVLMTGLHTGHTPIRGNQEVKPEGQAPLPAETVTLPEVLKEAGYATGAFGKWGRFPRFRRRPHQPGLRHLLRLQLPAHRPQLLSPKPLAQQGNL